MQVSDSTALTETDNSTEAFAIYGLTWIVGSILGFVDACAS